MEYRKKRRYKKTLWSKMKKLIKKRRYKKTLWNFFEKDRIKRRYGEKGKK